MSEEDETLDLAQRQVAYCERMHDDECGRACIFARALLRQREEIERLKLPPLETCSEHPGCAYCMEAGSPVRPGQVCPTCGDRLPSDREYWLRSISGLICDTFPEFRLRECELEYCPEEKWEQMLDELRSAIAAARQERSR